MKAAVNFKRCLFFVYRLKMKYMKRSPLKKKKLLLIYIK